MAFVGLLVAFFGLWSNIELDAPHCPFGSAHNIRLFKASSLGNGRLWKAANREEQ
jgi:hypothetical protein